MSLHINFENEVITQEDIIRYIEACCFEEEYNRAARLLELPIRAVGDIYSDNIDFVSELKAKCNYAQNNISLSFVETDEYPDWLYQIDHREPLGELIDCCVEYIENNEPLTFEIIKESCDECNQNAEEIIYSDEDIRKAISVAPLVFANQQNAEAEENANVINRLLATVDMLDITKNTNIYRQSFISIFSIFDAYVFDCLKKYYLCNIEDLESFFAGAGNEKTKLTYEAAIKFSDMASLKSAYVEQKFDGKYIRQILIQLHEKHPEVFNGIVYKDIMEMVNRRNVHIHNQGIVDNRYIEEYNIYGLDIGDYASISKQYFTDASVILKAFIKNLETKFSV